MFHKILQFKILIEAEIGFGWGWGQKVSWLQAVGLKNFFYCNKQWITAFVMFTCIAYRIALVLSFTFPDELYSDMNS